MQRPYVYTRGGSRISQGQPIILPNFPDNENEGNWTGAPPKFYNVDLPLYNNKYYCKGKMHKD